MKLTPDNRAHLLGAIIGIAFAISIGLACVAAVELKHALTDSVSGYGIDNKEATK